MLVAVTRAALKERQYSAVMAATGLLYLAILTAFGQDLVARAVLGLTAHPNSRRFLYTRVEESSRERWGRGQRPRCTSISPTPTWRSRCSSPPLTPSSKCSSATPKPFCCTPKISAEPAPSSVHRR